jgi:hypothetical protein
MTKSISTTECEKESWTVRDAMTAPNEIEKAAKDSKVAGWFLQEFNKSADSLVNNYAMAVKTLFLRLVCLQSHLGAC